MTLHIPSRRGFLTGLGAFFCAAPAIVRASSIMPVRAVLPYEYDPDVMLKLLHRQMDEAYKVLRENMERSLYGGGTFNIPNVAGENLFPLREFGSPVIFNFDRLDSPPRSE